MAPARWEKNNDSWSSRYQPMNELRTASQQGHLQEKPDDHFGRTGTIENLRGNNCGQTIPLDDFPLPPDIFSGGDNRGEVMRGVGVSLLLGFFLGDINKKNSDDFLSQSAKKKLVWNERQPFPTQKHVLITVHRSYCYFRERNQTQKVL